MTFIRHKTLALGIAALALSSCKTASFQSIKEPVADTAVSLEPQELPVKTKVKTKTKEVAALPPANTSSVANPIAMPADNSSKFEDVSEVFVQEGMRGAADILIVIDNSDSMREEQDNLSTKLNDLLVQVKDSDWQIGVVTTSVTTNRNVDTCSISMIKPSDSNFETKFKRAVTPGVKGQALEQGIRQAVNGLRCTEKPWVRPNSTVAVLIVSDEDNCSNGRGCNDQPSKTEQYLIDYVEKDMGRTVGVNAGFYGIFSPPASRCFEALNDANQYQRLVNYQSNGNINYGKICDASYKETLQRISKNIATLLVNKFILKAVPDEGSVVVSGLKGDGDPIEADDYVLAGSTLSFKPGSEPALKSSIGVNYRVTKAP
jgi:hypothetical protein